MATPVKTTTKKRGNLAERRKQQTQPLGPYKIYLPTGARDEEGSLIMVERENKLSGKFERLPELEEEPFLEAVYFKRNVYTAKREKQLKEMAASNKWDQMPLHSTMEALSEVLHDWDLTADGSKKVPPTFKGMEDNEVDSDIVYAVWAKFLEVTRPPKELSEKSPSTSSVEE